jgi:hypothetical protein
MSDDSFVGVGSTAGFEGVRLILRTNPHAEVGAEGGAGSDGISSVEIVVSSGFSSGSGGVGAGTLVS